jgi:hypothetical protein
VRRTASGSADGRWFAHRGFAALQVLTRFFYAGYQTGVPPSYAPSADHHVTFYLFGVFIQAIKAAERRAAHAIQPL